MLDLLKKIVYRSPFSIEREDYLAFKKLSPSGLVGDDLLLYEKASKKIAFAVEHDRIEAC